MNLIHSLIPGAYPIYFLLLLFIVLLLFLRSLRNIAMCFKGLCFKDLLIIFILMAVGYWLRVAGSSHIDLDPYGWRYIADALAIKAFFADGIRGSAALSTAVHVPGYPMLLVLPLTFYSDLGAISNFIIMFSILTIGLVYLLTYLLTEERLAALCSAGMFMVSVGHIRYSGSEVPITVSVFFITLAFLFFLLWLKHKKISIWWSALLIFILAVNIKIENLIWLPFFFVVSFCFWPQGHSRRSMYYGVVPVLISGIFLSYFVDQQLSFMMIMLDHMPLSRPSVDLLNIWEGIRLFFLTGQNSHIFFISGYLFMMVFNSDRRGALALAWLGWSLLYFLWDDLYSMETVSLQVFIPAFIICGIVVSKVLGIWFSNVGIRYALVALALVMMTQSANSKTLLRPYSWVELKRDLEVPSDSDCIVTPDIQTSAFALPFIFPKMRWVLEEGGKAQGLSQCHGKVYYFDPTKFGLAEEITADDQLQWEYFVETQLKVLGVRNGGEVLLNSQKIRGD